MNRPRFQLHSHSFLNSNRGVSNEPPRRYNEPMAVRLMRFSSFWIYPTVSVVLIRLAMAEEPTRSTFEYLWLVLIGILLWTLIEYGLHRFVFHWVPENRALRTIVAEFHLVHHARPRDPGRILARPQTTLPLSATILGIMFVLTGSAVMTTGITLGVWAGFLYYEWVHYRVHISSSVRGLNSHRRRHFAHHFVNDRTGFGVTSPLWDVVFGTYGKALVGGPGPDSAFPERLTALDRPTETAPSPKSSRTSTGRDRTPNPARRQ